MSDVSQGVGWWIASDGKWYPPELHPSQREVPVVSPPTTPEASPGTSVGPETSTPWPSAIPSSPASVDPGPSRYVSPYASTNAWPPATVPGGWPAPSLDAPFTAPATFTGATGPSSSASGADGQHRGGSRRRSLITASVGVVVLIVVIGGLLATVGSHGPSYPAKWNPRVLSIVHFVEHERGLSFMHPVNVEFLSSARFNKEVAVPQPNSKADRTAEAQDIDELRALGLVHGNVNLAQSENTLQQSDVVGLYVPEKKTVFVRGSSLTPFVRVTLAHELTHALQDQYFDLTTLRDNAAGDGSAVTALIEGDAVRVQDAYEQTMSVADQHAYAKASDQYDGSSGPASNVPAILSDIAEYPYAFGPTFIDDLVASGGTKAINNAFRHPPVAEAQIINPGTYPIGWRPAHVAAPSVPRGDRVTDPASPLGQLSLFEVLGSRLGYAPAWTAVQGWQGDSSLAYSDHGKTCDAIAVRMRTTARASSLASATRQWAADGVKQAVVRLTGDEVTIRSCDPGPDGPRLPDITPSAFDVLAARAQLIDGLMTQGHVDFALGACVSDNVISELGPSGYPELLANSLSDSQQAQLEQLFASAALSCRSQGTA